MPKHTSSLFAVRFEPSVGLSRIPYIILYPYILYIRKPCIPKPYRPLYPSTLRSDTWMTSAPAPSVRRPVRLWHPKWLLGGMLVSEATAWDVRKPNLCIQMCLCACVCINDFQLTSRQTNAYINGHSMCIPIFICTHECTWGTFRVSHQLVTFTRVFKSNSF